VPLRESPSATQSQLAAGGEQLPRSYISLLKQFMALPEDAPQIHAATACCKKIVLPQADEKRTYTTSGVRYFCVLKKEDWPALVEDESIVFMKEI
jgi:hypothetical protein